MPRISTLGGTWEGRLELELHEPLDRDRCLAHLRVVAMRWDPVREEWTWKVQDGLDLPRMLLRTDALVAFTDALRAWAALPLERLRVASFTYETELARGWPERVSIAVGPLPRYRLGDRALSKIRVVAGGRASVLAFAIDVSTGAAFADDVDDSLGALGLRSPRPPRLSGPDG